MTLLFSDDAIEDMQEITTYIAADNLERALSFWDELEEQAIKLTDFPGKGVPLEPNNDAYRVWHYGNYSIGYEITEKEIIVHKVYHQKRQSRCAEPIK